MESPGWIMAGQYRQPSTSTPANSYAVTREVRLKTMHARAYVLLSARGYRLSVGPLPGSDGSTPVNGQQPPGLAGLVRAPSFMCVGRSPGVSAKTSGLGLDEMTPSWQLFSCLGRNV